MENKVNEYCKGCYYFKDNICHCRYKCYGKAAFASDYNREEPNIPKIHKEKGGNNK